MPIHSPPLDPFPYILGSSRLLQLKGVILKR